jgi:hypothetical protein
MAASVVILWVYYVEYKSVYCLGANAEKRNILLSKKLTA